MASQPDYQERRLGRTVLRTYRAAVDLDDILPNNNQPRMGPKEDPELQRQIEANEGIFEPLLLEPHPEHEGKYRIIDGDRRGTNLRVLVEAHGKGEYRTVPAEVTDRTLTDEERYRVWIYIHRQRKEWDTKEKEMVAYQLVNLVGRASTANIIGITVRELDKFVDVYELSERLAGIREPGASITWARELRSISRKLMTPSVVNAVVKKVNDKKITNSKHLRKLRVILKDPIAKEAFLSEDGTIESAMDKLAPKSKPQPGLVGDIETLIGSIKKHPWTTLSELRGNRDALTRIEEAVKLLRELKKTLKE